MKAHGKAVIVLAVGIFLLMCAAVVFYCVSDKKPIIAFYGLDEKQVRGIEEVVRGLTGEEQCLFEFVVYDSAKKLEGQLLLSKSPEIIFTKSGFSVAVAEKSAEKKAGLSPECTDGMTSSMKSAVRYAESDGTDKTISALPILSGHFEIDVSRSDFRSSGMDAINSWSDIEQFVKIQKRKLEYPVVFAGKDSDVLLDLLGALTESLDGVAAYKMAAQIIDGEGRKFSAAEVAESLCDNPGSPLIRSVRQLSSWYKQGLVHPGVFSFTKSDVESFARNRMATVMFMPLEAHRKFNQEAISRYSSIYFPSTRASSARIFTGSIVYGVPISSSRRTSLLLESLMTDENQEKLSRATGLAPVLSQCRVPDKQASDARYWIAATNAPLPGLSSEVFLTPDQKNKLADEIVARIRFTK